MAAGAWLAAVWEFVGIICLAAPLKALTFYMEKRLIAVWRSALTVAFITAYTNNRAYFHMQLARGTEGNPASGSCSGKAADGASHETMLGASTRREDAPLTLQPFVGGLSSASACVDNPDQRVTADVANFVSTSVSLVLLLGKKVMNCAAFAGVLVVALVCLCMLWWYHLLHHATIDLMPAALTEMQLGRVASSLANLPGWTPGCQL